MKKNKKANSLGRSLIKDTFGHTSRRTVGNDHSMLHTTELQDGYDWGRLNLQSVTEESSLHDFLRTAELAGTEFQGEKLNIKYVNPPKNAGLLSQEERIKIEQKHINKRDLLTIPRRPGWTTDTSAEQLQKAESEAFLNWRRTLALLQEKDGLLLTPYEKNLEFWRQLWRVIERSDVIVQIVDARNPLLFRSEDLEKYVKEVDENKLNMVLINKADFLTVNQRIAWASYFDTQNVKVAFFSATLAAEEIRETKEKNENEFSNRTSEESCSDSEEGIKEPLFEDLKEAAIELSKKLNKTEEQLQKFETALGIDNDLKNTKVLTRSELIDLFKSIHRAKKYTLGVTTIGLVGYPNVGKSSTINSLMIEKKVSVSVTPGKTKHFQTLFLDNDLLLCDCPGLVMPSFVLTKSDMILNGILPIDQIRDHVPAINQLCAQIPRHTFEDKYGFVIAKPLEGEDPHRPPFSEELLLAYGFNRGFMTANGQPDQSRSARYILKDYVSGKLLYCHAPPGCKQEEFHTYPPRIRSEIEEQNLPKNQQRAIRINKNASSKDIDNQFFQVASNTAYVKGRSNFPHIRPAGSISGSEATSVDGSFQTLNTLLHGDKPWRTAKKEKREKLRKKFVHLDQH